MDEEEIEVGDRDGYKLMDEGGIEVGDGEG